MGGEITLRNTVSSQTIENQNHGQARGYGPTYHSEWVQSLHSGQTLQTWMIQKLLNIFRASFWKSGIFVTNVSYILGKCFQMRSFWKKFQNLLSALG